MYASRVETRHIDPYTDQNTGIKYPGDPEGVKLPTYVIRANVNQVSLTFGQLAFRSAILIFTQKYDPDTGKYVQWLVAQAPYCYGADCYVEWLTRDKSDAAHAFWWGSTYDSQKRSLVSAAGFPSGPA
jgi:hypothetical protein